VDLGPLVAIVNSVGILPISYFVIGRRKPSSPDPDTPAD